jgi:hypothetical protein
MRRAAKETTKLEEESKRGEAAISRVTGKGPWETELFYYAFPNSMILVDICKIVFLVNNLNVTFVGLVVVL